MSSTAPAFNKNFFKGVFLSNEEDIISDPRQNYQLNFSTRLRSHLDEGISIDNSIEAGNKFRRAFRKGKFKGDERYISVPLGFGSFAKVVQINETGITVNLITYNGQIKTLLLSNGDASRAKVSKTAKHWFERMEVAPDSVGPFDIPSFHEEEHLKALGFRKIFYAGLNEVKQLKYLAQLLREANINPFTTHIKDLVPLIDRTLVFIEKGIQEQDRNAKKMLEILISFKTEAQEKMEKQEVSLYWWMHWHLRLARLTSLTSYLSIDESDYSWWRTETGWDQYLNDIMATGNFYYPPENKSIIRLARAVMRYPEQTFLPLLKNLGIIALNEASVDEDFAIQITNKRKMVDGGSLNPFSFLEHEWSHIRIVNSERKNKKMFSQFYSQWRKVRDTVPREQREMVELVFFCLLREVGEGVNLADPTHVATVFLRDIPRFLNPDDLQAFLPPDLLSHPKDDRTPKLTYKIIENYLKKSAEVFNQTAQRFQFN